MRIYIGHVSAWQSKPYGHADSFCTRNEIMLASNYDAANIEFHKIAVESFPKSQGYYSPNAAFMDVTDTMVDWVNVINSAK